MATTATQPGPPDSGWTSADPIGETLHSLRMNGVVYTRSHLTAPWGIELPPMPDCVLFHVVTSGACRLEVKNEESCALAPGEFALVPHGQGHRILSAPGVEVENLFDLPLQQVSPRYEMLSYGGGGEPTTLICGAVRFDHPAASDLLKFLPGIIHLETWGAPHGELMHSTLRLMAAEVTGQRPGGETIVTRLADILVIQAVRTWLENSPEAQTGWLGALNDERIGPALLKIHREPTRDWTVASLAEEVCMSRSAFSARFTAIVGESPVQYLTRWRMHVAGAWLRDGEIGMAQCANRLGYTSEAAFSRAFKRVVGMSPGAWRRAGKNDDVLQSVS
jgi:AraC-like DNA-binding protein